MKSIIIGIDPGTKTAGVCVLRRQADGGYLPSTVCEVILDEADPYLMAREIVQNVLRSYLSFSHRDETITVVIENYRERHGCTASARVLETIGALTWALREVGCVVELVEHMTWRGEWLDFMMRTAAAGEKKPSWMIDLKEHELDAAKMAWLEVEKQSTGPAEPGKKD